MKLLSAITQPSILFVEPLDVDIERSNVPTPIKRIYAPHTYYETAILTITRGPRRLPFRSIVPVLCECLNKPPSYLLYYNPTNCWSQFSAIASPLQDSAIDENWVFYISKLIDVKMWIRPESMSCVEDTMKRYGDKNFFRRIHEQMIMEGNILTCGHQGVDEFSFDNFSG